MQPYGEDPAAFGFGQQRGDELADQGGVRFHLSHDHAPRDGQAEFENLRAPRLFGRRGELGPQFFGRVRQGAGGLERFALLGLAQAVLEPCLVSFPPDFLAAALAGALARIVE